MVVALSHRPTVPRSTPSDRAIWLRKRPPWAPLAKRPVPTPLPIRADPVELTHERVLSDPELRRRYEDNNFKLPADHAHITGGGRWLRETSLGELPQLENVLRGEMALVGERPLKPEELALRDRYDRELYCRHRPSLTGLRQVHGRSAIGGDHRIELDRECLEQWGVWWNLKILLRTPAVVLCGDGAHRRNCLTRHPSHRALRGFSCGLRNQIRTNHPGLWLG